MDFKPKAYEKITRLLDKGVDIPNPLTLDIGDEVDLDLISGNGVKIYPGCRIYGASTVIAEGAQLGFEGPATVQDCQIGPKVELKAGFFNKAVFLEKANMGLGAHVREGCILEEEANGAHCVGLKQTILFPFVTLGSLINFCDCLLAGGTSRKNHSEVGSSYIHFNYTPNADKTTPSLLGDVPRGVMLNQPPIFLGGQGGIVGPIRTGFGIIAAAGSVLRKDYTNDNKLVIGRTAREMEIDFLPLHYPTLSRIVENNLLYMANLIALEQWYNHVRQPFFAAQEFGDKIFEGALARLASAKKERSKRLKAMAEKMPESLKTVTNDELTARAKSEFFERIDEVLELYTGNLAADISGFERDQFKEHIIRQRSESDAGYIKVIQDLPQDAKQLGTYWLNSIVDEYCQRTIELLPALELFMRKISNLTNIIE